MKIQLISDVHCEFDSDLGKYFADSLDPSNVDVLVIAGDLIPLIHYQNAEDIFSRLCDKYKRVIFTPGNHEYYHSTTTDVDGKLRILMTKFAPKLKVLFSGEVYFYDSQRFIGGTLWFNEPTGPAERAKAFMSDFKVIKGFEPWVYVRNTNTIKAFKENMEPRDVVITHHLPSMKSVHHKYRNSSLNAFFVCEQDKLILERKPCLWLSGHTHFAYDCMLGDTRLVCNPRGYPNEVGTDFNPKLVIEV